MQDELAELMFPPRMITPQEDLSDNHARVVLGAPGDQNSPPCIVFYCTLLLRFVDHLKTPGVFGVNDQMHNDEKTS